MPIPHTDVMPALEFDTLTAAPGPGHPAADPLLLPVDELPAAMSPPEEVAGGCVTS